MEESNKMKGKIIKGGSEELWKKKAEKNRELYPYRFKRHFFR